MDQKIEGKVTEIKTSLQRAGLKVAEGKKGIRVRLDNGYAVDIFSLTNNPGQVRARLKINEADPIRRQACVESIKNSIAGSLEGVAAIEPFKLSREAGGSYIYNSVLVPEEIVFDDAPIEISDDAIEIVDDAVEIIEDVTMVEDQDPGDIDPGAFELDLDLAAADCGLKVVKSLAEEAIEKLESVDAKMLRQSLDRMDLKRSSAVRLAVTRIFRSATEAAELEKAIQDEAKKIMTPGGRAELRELKSLSINGFLGPVVSLLWQEVFNGEC